jgi:hypothetical protein
MNLGYSFAFIACFLGIQWSCPQTKTTPKTEAATTAKIDMSLVIAAPFSLASAKPLNGKGSWSAGKSLV